jgi:ribonuclease E
MPNKMLIDATHPEETRVVVVRGNRVEEFDFESANRKQLRGNIYLAKVTRVEPSLQAAFIDYGGNRHGFLAFSEIHPDYYQIPVADRQALIDEEERAARAADAEADNRARRHSQRGARSERSRDVVRSEPAGEGDEPYAMMGLTEATEPSAGEPDASSHESVHEEPAAGSESVPTSEVEPLAVAPSTFRPSDLPAPVDEVLTSASEAPIDLAALESHAASEPVPNGDHHHPFFEHPVPAEPASETVEAAAASEPPTSEVSEVEGAEGGGSNVTEVNGNGSGGDEEAIESVGGADAMEEVPERMPRARRQYKIQEVIKRRQVMLVQVVKEERGTKGAALTTYLSLAGRYSVLMPNTARGGGISRKITSAEDRRRLKDIAQELEVPEGMGVILRTAGAARTKTEVKRDFEYLLRLWETVRDLTLQSTAPTLVYEEGSLIKRSIRDLYNKDIDEVLVAGDGGFDEAKDFMRMLMPSHAKNVKSYRDGLPIYTRFAIESQLDAMFQPVVQLRSGGYIVLNQTEALVAIDVNSGRATREHHIEDTALKTNIEAAEEISRQLRLRDLAGLIVIDFIDMDEKRNNRTVERRLKDALKHDRARIQVGHISHFGLLEMSRQRIRSSVLESSTDKCPHCGGSGHVRSVSSVALQLLRALEEMLLKGATHNLIVRTRTEIALYLLNQKRAHLRMLEERFQVSVTINADPTVAAQTSYLLEKGEQVHSLEQAKAIAIQPTSVAPVVDEEEDDDAEAAIAEDEEQEAEAATPEAVETVETVEADNGRGERDGGNGRRRRRRRGRRGEEREGPPAERAAASEGEHSFAPESEIAPTPDAGIPVGESTEDEGEETEEAAAGAPETSENGSDQDRRRRRRGRRGGRRNRRGPNGDGSHVPEHTDSEHPPSDSEHASPDAVAAFAAELETTKSEAGSEAEWPVEQHEPAAMQEQPAHRAEPIEHHAEQQMSLQHEPSTPAQPAEPAAVAPSAPEPSRRRSTVREAAPIRPEGQEAVAPIPLPVAAPEPAPVVVVSGNDAEEAARPRRSGWWSKKVLGKG